MYTYFRAWDADGTWIKLNDALRTMLRLAAGRNAQPSAGSVGKQVKGRKRTILVDTMGLLLGVCVHSAKRSDHAGMILLATFWAWMWQCLQVIWVDSTFAGKDFMAKVAQYFGCNLEHLKRTDDEPGFQVIPKRLNFANSERLGRL